MSEADNVQMQDFLARLSRQAWSYDEILGNKREWSPRQNPRSVTASSNVNPLDAEIRCDATAGAITMTLESATACDGRRHYFKKTDSGTNTVSITTADGATQVLRHQYDAMVVISNGTTWDVLTGWGTDMIPRMGTWTPALTFGTPGDLAVTYTTQVGTWNKVGAVVRASFNIVTSGFTHTTAAGNATITGLPFTSSATTNNVHRGPLDFQGITKLTYTNYTSALAANSAALVLAAGGSGVARALVTTADMPTGGSVILIGTITYQAA